METKFILIGNQKGGIGKTTFTVILASYLHYVTDKKILVVDGDFPQWSIHETRQRELSLLSTDDKLKLRAIQQFKQTGKKHYPILNVKPSEAIESTHEYLDGIDEEFDIVLFDLPGALNAEGIFHTISNMDYIFVPMKADKLVMESTLTYSSIIQERLVGKSNTNIKAIYLFWTMIDRREKTPLYGQYESIINELDLPVLSTTIPYRSRFNKEIMNGENPVFRSTILPAEKQFINECSIAALAEEILSKIGI